MPRAIVDVARTARPSVCLSRQSTAATTPGGSAAWRHRRLQTDIDRQLRTPCCRRRRSAANAGSVTLTVDGEGSTHRLVQRVYCNWTCASIRPSVTALSVEPSALSFCMCMGHNHSPSGLKVKAKVKVALGSAKESNG